MPPSGVKTGTKRARQYEKIKNRARSGETRTKEQLYKQAKRLRIDGRSSMNKSQLQRAVAAKRG